LGAEENRAAALEFLEQAWMNGDLTAYERFVSPDQVLHLAGYPEPFYGREQALAWARTYQSAFRDLSLEIEAVLAEGDTVAVRFRTSQTHRGEYLGVKPLGTRVSMLMLQMFRFADGKIAEVWLMFDPLNVMQQLGVLPPGQMPKPLLAVINTVRRLRRPRNT
jgi:predicted ester cyclase